MPKVRCRCDAVISLGEVPSEHQYMFMSDCDFDNWHGNVQAEDIYQAMDIYVKCPECKGLLVFWNGFSKDSTYYRAETETAKELTK